METEESRDLEAEAAELEERERTLEARKRDLEAEKKALRAEAASLEGAEVKSKKPDKVTLANHRTKNERISTEKFMGSSGKSRAARRTAGSARNLTPLDTSPYMTSTQKNQ